MPHNLHQSVGQNRTTPCFQTKVHPSCMNAHTHTQGGLVSFESVHYIDKSVARYVPFKGQLPDLLC